MTVRIPVTTIEDLDSLDAQEVFVGYRSGLSGDPEPGNNHSRAYWHGWRNGAVDGGHREKDEAQAALARQVALFYALRCAVPAGGLQ